MQQDSWKRYKNILLDEKKRLKKQLDYFFDNQNLSQSEAAGELSDYDNHPADNATDTADREIQQGLKDNVLTIMKKVDDALEKLETEEYGICQKCGKDISDDRLDVIPYTNFCEICQKEEESLEGVRRRPTAEEFHFQLMTVDRSDGEDVWRALEAYGTSSGPAYPLDPEEKEDIDLA